MKNMGGVSGLRSALRENAAKTQIARAMTAIEEGPTLVPGQVRCWDIASG